MDALKAGSDNTNPGGGKVYAKAAFRKARDTKLARPRPIGASVLALRHQLGVADLDRAAFEIDGDVLVILGDPLEQGLDLAVGQGVREPAGTFRLAAVIGGVLHAKSCSDNLSGTTNRRARRSQDSVLPRCPCPLFGEMPALSRFKGRDCRNRQ